ncbi:hypothetical protein RvY_00117 [Ramazzottius varieornatus]|uniref:CTCK domain-containing protein n=1 Tax=Ramazzottius varieornatus TaxID=947166 RepID=A0A1D1UBL0_RAMVA|nr:hypothetical protein RvY_00117 [Ramazzottius varieornatus]
MDLFCFLFFCIVYPSAYGQSSNSLLKDSQSPSSENDKTLSCPKSCHKVCRAYPEKCPDGVSLVEDLCGCGCYHCARQDGDECSALDSCEIGLHCSRGTCRASHPKSCEVNGNIYQDGESWKPDCQTVCQCVDGVYGCSDVCLPDKKPSECEYGRQLVVESECCSRWVCQQEVIPCSNITLDWTDCSCAVPISHQWTNRNPDCQWTVQQRSCPTKGCTDLEKARFVQATVDDITNARRSCSNTMYHRYAFIEEDNCKSTHLVHQRTCARECRLPPPDGRKLCCLPNEFESKSVRLRCANKKVVLRTIAMIAGCSCDLC